MSSVQHLREFISERLTAAAEEIFSVFQRTIEEEMDRQRRLLDVTWRPEVQLDRTELPHQFLRKEVEEIPADQQLWKPGPDQEEPDPPRIKEELDGFCFIRGEEQLVLKPDADVSTVTSAYRQASDSEAEPNGDRIRCSWSKDSESTRDPELKKRRSRTRSPAGFWSNEGEQPVLKEEPDLMTPEDRDLLIPLSLPAAEVRDPEGSWNKEELKSKKRRIRKNSQVGQSGFGPNAGLRPVSCDVCGKAFRCNSEMRVHSRVHTGEKPFSCDVCQRAFSFKVNLSVHMRTHTGEKPYACKFCDKRFSDHSSLRKHTNVHTGERPYSCAVCGKRFSRSSHMWRHVRVHAAEAPST